MEEETVKIPEQIGKYRILRQLGRGGMGEVLLAEDPSCGRQVAIKRIREDLAKHPSIAKRFLREAHITASLYHPSIIPVYSIHQEEEELYYVMPYVEGESLKSILRKTLLCEKNNEPPHPIGSSINKLIPIFFNVCQAVSYCHSRGLLHRDLKPENILVGNFGQVLIVDWGLAGAMNEQDTPSPEIPNPQKTSPNLTRPGKVLGTLSYMPPERVDGKPAGISTDIYSLGVILYQLLTLKMPFRRTTIKEYKKIKDKETLLDPLEASPARDIPPQLAKICRKCLAKEEHLRYNSITEILVDLEKYNAGFPDWIFTKSLAVQREEDWELQENVLLSKLVPITGSTEIMQWHVLMISKESFSGNKRLEILLSLEEDSEGVGFLLNIPEPKEREGLEEGYCIWIGSKKNPGIKLYRSHVVLFDLSGRYIESGQNTLIEIEKIDQTVHLFINRELLINYTDPLPIVGTHVGILSQDMEFSLSFLRVYVGSQNAVVGCLSIPDAFLASKNFEEAYAEYVRIADSFSGRSEGRDALFRAGITLIERSKRETVEYKKTLLLEEALLQFDRLHHTPSEPLEYLGKSLVYHRMGNTEEELKCLELGIRKYKNHALARSLEERVLFRLHESAKQDRMGVYQFALLTLRHLPLSLSNRETHALIHNLSTYAEKLYFFPPLKQFNRLKERYDQMAVQLAFWLDKPLTLQEMLKHESSVALQETIHFALHALGHHDESTLSLEKIHLSKNEDLSSLDPRKILFLLEKDLTRKNAKEILSVIKKCQEHMTLQDFQKSFAAIEIWALLLAKDWEQADLLLSNYERESTEKVDSPFYMLKGCLLAQTNGPISALKHFERTSDYVYPPLYSLLAHYLKGNTLAHNRWHKQAFSYEKKALLSQQTLYYHSLGKSTKAAYFERKKSQL